MCDRRNVYCNLRWNVRGGEGLLERESLTQFFLSLAESLFVNPDGHVVVDSSLTVGGDLVMTAGSSLEYKHGSGTLTVYGCANITGGTLIYEIDPNTSSGEHEFLFAETSQGCDDRFEFDEISIPSRACSQVTNQHIERRGVAILVVLNLDASGCSVSAAHNATPILATAAVAAVAVGLRRNG